MKCPCRDCADRTAECHGDCPRYAEWDAWNKKRKSWLKAQLPITSEGVKKRETEKIRQKARYGSGGRWKGGNTDG